MTAVDRTNDTEPSTTAQTDTLALSITTALQRAGLDGPAVVVERECDAAAVQVDWKPTRDLGDAVGHTARAGTARAGRWFLRRVLALQAPVYGWFVTPEADPYEYVNPVRITW